MREEGKVLDEKHDLELYKHFPLVFEITYQKISICN